MLVVFDRQVGRQNATKIDSKKHGKKQRAKHPFWKVLGGGSHAAGMASRGLSDPLNQTPLELGLGLGLGKGKGLGTDKHRHKGKGKDTGQVGRMTHSRRRAGCVESTHPALDA